jgi:Bacterial Ig-like domain (group 3)
MLFRGIRGFALLLIATVVLLGVGQAGATKTAAPTALYVSPTGADSGTCPQTSPCATVSYALTQAATGAVIRVSGTVNNCFTINSPVTITTWRGGPAGSPGALSGATCGTVVINAVRTAGVMIKDLTIEGACCGGSGISNEQYATMKLADSTVSGNDNGIGNNLGSMEITDSTIAGNPNYGLSGGPFTIIASTIANNGGGIFGAGGTGTKFAASIVANNTSYNCSEGTFESAGYNLTNDATGTACGFTTALDLVDKNPQLGSLAANGGPTQTMLPNSSSPAADVIPNPTTLDGVEVCPGTDQRGVTRPGNGETRCTIGAAEVSAPNATTSKVTVIPATVTAGTRVAYLIVVKPKAGTGTPTGSVTFTIGTTKLCKAALSGGDAACGATNAPVGTDTVTGTYSGGSGYASSSGTTTLTVS